MTETKFIVSTGCSSVARFSRKKLPQHMIFKQKTYTLSKFSTIRHPIPISSKKVVINYF